MVGSGKNMESESWLYLLEGLDRWNMHSLKIAGMEPTLHPHLTNLISTTQSFNTTDVSMTTNGSRLASILPDLVDAGLDRLTVSLHTLNPFIYKHITRGSILPVLEALDLCADFGIPTKLNVVLLRGVNDNIRNLLEYASIYNFELKLYPLLWQPHFESDYERYFVSWNEVLQPFTEDWRGLEITEFVNSQRYRYTLETESGVRVTTSWFQQKNDSTYQLCRNCPLKSKCEEGFMGYGFETDSSLALNPCYLRPELRINLKPFLERKYRSVKKRLNRMAYGGRKD
jgi:cyclic pyranopterin phosphate synthase